MSIVSMKEFLVSLESGETVRTVCADLKTAAATYDTDLNPSTQIVRTRVGIMVNVPDETLDINFRTVIGGVGADTAGCRATPSTFAVPDATEVIFEAFAADGYNFVGWYIGSNTSGVPESTASIASIAITGTLGVSQDVIITALFAPVV